MGNELKGIILEDLSALSGTLNDLIELGIITDLGIDRETCKPVIELNKTIFNAIEKRNVTYADRFPNSQFVTVRAELYDMLIESDTGVLRAKAEAHHEG